ncbi:MAG: alpha-L-arabinofuranosidase [Bacteroidales bacterium]|nr:alpha-L-arabinofuranosidase [Bacteroidales bacterium]
MNPKIIALCGVICLTALNNGFAQNHPGIFVNDWKSKNIENPVGVSTPQTSATPDVSITIDIRDTVNKVSKYIFGGNLNPYSSLFKHDSIATGHLKNLSPNVLRWPGGNLSNEYFWNAATAADLPTDLPARLAIDAPSTTQRNYWLGMKQNTKDATTPDYYKTLKETNATGCICVNYGYARYGKSANSVQKAAQLAADWVRYDKGRTRFWEIGNENFGNWQSGYELDPSLYTDGRPKFISGATYGAHCLVFIDSMRKAAHEVGAEIYIGVQAWEDYTSWDPIQTAWNDGLFQQVRNKADFIILHNYYTPYQDNSTIPTIFNSLSNTKHFNEVLQSYFTKYSLNPMPLALTEYNIQCRDSAQLISYINGMHATMVLCDAIKLGFGMAQRWSTVGWWSGVSDMGTFSYNEPGVRHGNMRPEFFYLYYLQKYMGDVMVKTISDNADVAAYASTFSSGQCGIVLANKSKTDKKVKVKMSNFKHGAQYHYYLLKGGTDNGSFSSKVFVNGQGPADLKGGPTDTYEKIKPYTTALNGDIVIELPPYGTIFMLVEGAAKPAFKSANTGSEPDKISLSLSMPVSNELSATGFSVVANGNDTITVTNIVRNDPDSAILTFTLGRNIVSTDKITPLLLPRKDINFYRSFVEQL